MSVQTQQIHRRKTSKEDSENIVIPSVEVVVPDENELPSVKISAPPPRVRTQSTPQPFSGQSSLGSPGPYRSTFVPRPMNGHSVASPLRSSFAPTHMNGHARTRSTSTPFSPMSPSPLSSSFPSNLSPPGIQASRSASEVLDGQPAAAAKHTRRHSRMHSRNLSVFFPRPGSLPHNAISEDGDGAQEVVLPADEEAPLVPSAGSNVSVPGRRAPLTPLGQGFTFGQRPPSSAQQAEFIPPPSSGTPPLSATAKKRGHHHKHSLSHNFFSFLEPTSTTPVEELHTQPTPMPMSPWGPISAFAPDSAAAQTGTSSGFKMPAPPPRRVPPPPPKIQPTDVASAAGQFVLGAYLWVAGQQVGSLSVTGLGYWVVFDAFGIALACVVPGWLAAGVNTSKSEKERERIRRPYGNGRVETVLMFAQAVYLMFSSVYVCKETVEHLLLSAGDGDGHHHHHGDEDIGIGIDFPIFMTFITFFSLIATALFFENNTQLVNITNNRIRSLGALLRSVWAPLRHTHDPPPTTPFSILLSNPFVVSPLIFSLGILSVALLVSPEQHRTADLALAMLIAVVTFNVAYRACVVLGAVLLQTSPPRGLPSGKMEAFLRAMREVERHPQVLHLPAPHIWQLTPSIAAPPTPSGHHTSPTRSSFAHDAGSGKAGGGDQAGALVVTLELHVRADLGDEDVLKLTRWAWERCVGALAVGMGGLREWGEEGEEGGMQVTVGVVKG